MKRLFKIFKELSNYFYIGSVISKNKGTAQWKKFNLRTGWFNTIFAVINLPPEVYEATPDIHKLYVIDQISQISDYFGTLNLLEIVEVTTEKIEGVPDQKPDERIDAYLVTFPPLFQEFTLWWLIKWALFISVATWLQLAYNPIGALVKLAVTLFGFIASHAK